MNSWRGQFRVYLFTSKYAVYSTAKISPVSTPLPLPTTRSSFFTPPSAVSCTSSVVLLIGSLDVDDGDEEEDDGGENGDDDDDDDDDDEEDDEGALLERPFHAGNNLEVDKKASISRGKNVHTHNTRYTLHLIFFCSICESFSYL